MNKLLVVLLLPLMLLAGAGFLPLSAARADTFSVSVDVPVTYSFAETGLSDPSASGILIGVQLPLFMNLGIETYTVTGQANVAPVPAGSFEYQVAMLDIYFDLPIPAVNLVLGAGVGQGVLDVAGSPGAFGNATLYQGYFSLGIPFAGVFDAHVGYHKIFGEADITATSNKVNLDSSMATVGVKVGF